jgi:hypothetical protein
MSVWHVFWDGAVKRLAYSLRRSLLWLTVGVGMWLCGLPLCWRGHSFPRLLQGLTPAPGRGQHGKIAHRMPVART